jgi:hypothetical protein
MRTIVLTRLRGLMPGVQVDWNLSAQGTKGRRVALFLIGGRDQYHNQGRSGQRVGRLQVDCYASTYADAVALAALARNALSGWSDRAQGIQGVFLIGETDLAPDTDGGRDEARVSTDYNITWQED